MTTQLEKAQLLLKMHADGGLLLPNAWDVASARIFEEAGFPAIATTSAGIAFSNGYPDGQKISREDMLAVVRRIVDAVRVPVTADVEAGYGDAPEAVATTVRAVIDAGAVGINLEDATGVPHTLYEPEAQAARIAAGRAAAESAGVHVVINARTDTYLGQVGAPETRYDETLRRARIYRDAGADCIFVPGVADAELIRALVQNIDAPVNILVGASSPSASELFGIGVARISVGSSAMQAIMGLTREIAHELRDQGTYTSIGKHQYGYAEAAKLLSRG
jgi:2-methylisocitrate lyase-like PEP mutase family enzyme